MKPSISSIRTLSVSRKTPTPSASQPLFLRGFFGFDALHANARYLESKYCLYSGRKTGEEFYLRSVSLTRYSLCTHITLPSPTSIFCTVPLKVNGGSSCERDCRAPMMAFAIVNQNWISLLNWQGNNGPVTGRPFDRSSEARCDATFVCGSPRPERDFSALDSGVLAGAMFSLTESTEHTLFYRWYGLSPKLRRTYEQKPSWDLSSDLSRLVGNNKKKYQRQQRPCSSDNIATPLQRFQDRNRRLPGAHRS